MQSYKRGPASGKIEELENTIKNLEEQIQQEQVLFQQIQAIVDGVTDSDVQDEQSLVLATQHQNSQESKRRRNAFISYAAPQRTISTLFQTYFQIYQEYLFPMCGVPTLNIDSSDILNNEGNDQTTLVTYSILSNAAQMVGNANHAREFVHRASLIIRDYYQYSDTFLAGAHSLLTNYYCNEGNVEKYMNHNMLALTMSKTLLSRSEMTDQHERQVLPFAYAVSLMNQLDGYWGTNYQLHQTIRERLEHFTSKFPFEGQQLIYFIIEISEILMLITSLDHQDIDIYRRTVLMRLEAADRLVPSFRSQSIRDGCWSFLTSLRATLYHISGDRELALKYCRDTILQMPTNSQYANPFNCGSLSIIAQIHLYEGCFDSLAQDLEILTKYTLNFPSAQNIIDWINDPERDQKYLLWPMIHIRYSKNPIEEDFFPDPILASMSSDSEETNNHQSTPYSPIIDLPDNIDVSLLLHDVLF